MEHAAGVVIPIRAFDDAKQRLAPQLDAAQREQLARQLAKTVVEAAAPLPTLVVSSAPEVRRWATDLGVAVIDDPGSLDQAARTGVEWFRNRNAARVIVAHADLPQARALAALATDAGRLIVTLVPDHRNDGTPVCAVPTAIDFAFSYGPASFRRHVESAQRAGCAVRVLRTPGLRIDVDLPDDLALMGR